MLESITDLKLLRNLEKQAMKMSKRRNITSRLKIGLITFSVVTKVLEEELGKMLNLKEGHHEKSNIITTKRC